MEEGGPKREGCTGRGRSAAGIDGACVCRKGAVGQASRGWALRTLECDRRRVGFPRKLTRIPFRAAVPSHAHMRVAFPVNPRFGEKRV